MGETGGDQTYDSGDGVQTTLHTHAAPRARAPRRLDNNVGLLNEGAPVVGLQPRFVSGDLDAPPSIVSLTVGPAHRATSKASMATAARGPWQSFSR